MNHETPVTMTPRGLEALKAFATEIAIYRRELPRLLEENQAGRYLVIRGEQMLGIFASWGEANTWAREKYGIEPIFITKINADDLERYALLDTWMALQCRP